MMDVESSRRWRFFPGETIDPKRYLWALAAIILPITGVTIAAYFVFGDFDNASGSGGAVWAVFIPLVYFFAVVPFVDHLLGEDPHNLGDAELQRLEHDAYYAWLLRAMVPIYYLSFFAALAFVGTQNLPLWAMVVFAFGIGNLHGNSITIAHELGHKHNHIDQWAAKLMLAMIGYAHFTLEHNRGHHVWVATPEDHASARMGESVYAFAWRELPGALKRGLAFERDRLARQGKGFWSLSNDILQGYAITLTIAFISIAWLGWQILPFILIHHAFGWYALTQANYVEHYGLKRRKLDNGRYEPCEPHHSWNTNHIFSNLMTFHLQRHSDHHANPQRPYQTLRNFPDLPRLPSGYPGCFALAAIPPLWFRVMDTKVKAWAENDWTRINLDPVRYREHLTRE